ncbi:hypothetical protein VNI00_004490 [Paramarasmius palmivorus]|uniref:Uncharacterized protein n=1 Tax=Paramarasmius palmivorus TaxID=297713 RepID=A0AAW0DKR6_9AGAR
MRSISLANRTDDDTGSYTEPETPTRRGAVFEDSGIAQTPTNTSNPPNQSNPELPGGIDLSKTFIGLTSLHQTIGSLSDNRVGLETITQQLDTMNATLKIIAESLATIAQASSATNGVPSGVQKEAESEDRRGVVNTLQRGSLRRVGSRNTNSSGTQREPGSRNIIVATPQKGSLHPKDTNSYHCLELKLPATQSSQGLNHDHEHSSMHHGNYDYDYDYDAMRTAMSSMSSMKEVHVTMDPIVGYDAGQSPEDLPEPSSGSHNSNESALVAPSDEHLFETADDCNAVSSSIEQQVRSTTNTELPPPIQHDDDAKVNVEYTCQLFDFVQSTTNNYGHHNTTTTCETRMIRSRFGVRAFGTETYLDENSVTGTPAGRATRRSPSEPSLRSPPLNADRTPDTSILTSAPKKNSFSVTLNTKDICILLLLTIILLQFHLLMVKSEEIRRLWAVMGQK